MIINGMCLAISFGWAGEYLAPRYLIKCMRTELSPDDLLAESIGSMPLRADLPGRICAFSRKEANHV
jgi:hypothetical protein